MTVASSIYEIFIVKHITSTFIFQHPIEKLLQLFTFSGQFLIDQLVHHIMNPKHVAPRIKFVPTISRKQPFVYEKGMCKNYGL